MNVGHGKRPSTTLDVAGKRVLVRVDFNVPLGRMAAGRRDDTRIRAALPTIEAAARARRRGRAVSRTWGGPRAVEPELSLEPVGRAAGGAARAPRCAGARLSSAPRSRRWPRAWGRATCCCSRTCASTPERRSNDPELAASLAALGDLYVNDAFGAAHRAHASTAGVARAAARRRPACCWSASSTSCLGVR